MTTTNPGTGAAETEERPDSELAAAAKEQAEEQELAMLRSGSIGPGWRATLDEIAGGVFRHLDRSRRYPLASIAPRTDMVVVLRLLLLMFGPIAFGVTAERTKGSFGDAVPWIGGASILIGMLSVFGGVRRPPSRRTLRRLREDLKAGVVVNESATVAVVGGRCVSQVGARPLVMTASASDTLIRCLGPHRAFFLPRSGLVLAVEPAGADGGYRADRGRGHRGVDRNAMDAVLARACGFETQWAAANRAGRLAPGQWKAMFRGYFNHALEIFTTGIVVRTMFVLGSRWSHRHDPRFATIADQVDAAWIVLFIAVPLVIILQHLVRVAVAIAVGKVRTAEGVTDFNANPWFSSQHTGFCDGIGIWGPVVIGQLGLGRVLYRAHYVPGVNLLVGIEVVEVGEAPVVWT